MTSQDDEGNATRVPFPSPSTRWYYAFRYGCKTVRGFSASFLRRLPKLDLTL